mgnify:CR=1 FL=1
MQALFLCLAFTFHAAGLIEADVAAITLPVAVLVARLAILTADFIRLAQNAFYVRTGHAAAYLLFDHCAAAGAAGDAVATAVLRLAHHYQFASVVLRRVARRLPDFRQWDGLAATGGWTMGLLQLLVLFAGAAAPGEGDVATAVFAAKHG